MAIVKCWMNQPNTKIFSPPLDNIYLCIDRRQKVGATMMFIGLNLCLLWIEVQHLYWGRHFVFSGSCVCWKHSHTNNIMEENHKKYQLRALRKDHREPNILRVASVYVFRAYSPVGVSFSRASRSSWKSANSRATSLNCSWISINASTMSGSKWVPLPFVIMSTATLCGEGCL